MGSASLRSIFSALKLESVLSSDLSACVRGLRNTAREKVKLEWREAVRLRIRMVARWVGGS